MRVVALGGEKMTPHTIRTWGQGSRSKGAASLGTEGRPAVVLLNTYGVTEVAVYQTAGRLYASDVRCDEEADEAGEAEVVRVPPGCAAG